MSDMFSLIYFIDCNYLKRYTMDWDAKFDNILFDWFFNTNPNFWCQNILDLTRVGQYKWDI